MVQHNSRGPVPRLRGIRPCLARLLGVAACMATAIARLPATPAEPAPGNDVASTAATAVDVYGDPLPKGAVARLGTTRWRHSGNVTFVTFGADGTRLFTSGQDNLVRLWDLASGKELRRFERPNVGGINRPTRAAGADAVVVQRLAGMRSDPNTFCVAVALDGKTLAASNASAVQLFDVESGKSLRRIDSIPAALTGLLFSPDGSTLAARGGDGEAIVWNTATGAVVQRIQAPPRPDNRRLQVDVAVRAGGEAPGMAFAPDGKSLAVATTQFKEQAIHNSVKIWDVGSGKELAHIKGPDGSTVSAVAYSPAGDVVAYGAQSQVYLCESDTGKELRQIKVQDTVASMAFSPNGNTLAVRGRSQQVRILDVESGKELSRLGEMPAPGPIAGALVLAGNAPTPESRNLAYSPDGKRIVTAAHSTVRVWDTSTGKELPLSNGHHGPLTTIGLAANGKSAVSWGLDDRRINRWDTETGKPLGSVRALPGLAAFTPDARLAALLAADNAIRVVDTSSGKELHRFERSRTGVGALVFAPDGKVLAARGGDGAIRMFDIVNGKELRSINESSSSTSPTAVVAVDGRIARNSRAGLVFSPDGQLLASPSSSGYLPGTRTARNTINLFDVTTGKLLRKLDTNQPVVSAAFSPDGRLLATEFTNQTITLWEVASGQPRERLIKLEPSPQPDLTTTAFAVAARRVAVAEPAGPVSLAFAPDGQVLAARGPNNTLQMWDVATGKEVGRFPGHAGRVETIAFASDGKTVATGSADTTVLLWNAAFLRNGAPTRESIELTKNALESLWHDLASDVASKAFLSVLKLGADPSHALPFLSERLPPISPIDSQKVERLIAALESEKYSVRQEAGANLLKSGEQVAPALQRVLASRPTIETRKRVEELLDKLTGGTLSSEQLRQVRAVEALERMGTQEARDYLQKLAGGAAGALMTRQAQAAVERLARR